MKAFALTSATEPASVIDLPDPEVAPDGARIRVQAASVNGFDVFQANGYLTAMMEHDFPVVVGRDFSGVVESVGPERSDIAVGDEVIGFVSSAPPLHVGTFAELVAGSSLLTLAPRPLGLSPVEAAAIPLAGATALAAVDAVEVKPGDVVVVAGATGGVGSIAVQLAAQRGATVIATARAGAAVAFVKDLGATTTIDYSAGDPAAAIRALYPNGVDALVDSANRGETFGPMAELVRDGGRIATSLGSADVEALAARGVIAENVRGAPTPENLQALAAQVVAGTLRIHIQATFPLDDAAQALATFSAGTIGKIVLTIG